MGARAPLSKLLDKETENMKRTDLVTRSVQLLQRVVWKEFQAPYHPDTCR